MNDQPTELQGPPAASLICLALIRIGTRTATRFDQHFVDYDITHAQFRLLLAIRSYGDDGISPSALAEQLSIERATASVMTNRLVERGLLRRIHGSSRRTFNLALTQEGIAALQPMFPAATDLAVRTMRYLDDFQMTEILNLLLLVEQGLTELKEPDPNS